MSLEELQGIHEKLQNRKGPGVLLERASPEVGVLALLLRRPPIKSQPWRGGPEAQETTGIRIIRLNWCLKEIWKQLNW